uniref:Oxygen-evolving enhancer protein 3-2, chloroplastic n=1 Tax=Anthurium amnicola TaxID=1678845 RepID=A0A1D1ZHD5_9ARAE
MEGTECGGNMYRIRECASDLLLSMEDELAGGDEGAWELMGRDLRLKSTFLFCDLTRLISAAGDGDLKRSLTALANRLFHHMEELARAVKSRSVPQTQSCYTDAAVVLHEVVAAMVPFSLGKKPAITQ